MIDSTLLLGGRWHTLQLMTPHTMFRFSLDPTVEQQKLLARPAGAAQFAYNRSLRAVQAALTAGESTSHVKVPWTGFDLINAFNRYSVKRHWACFS
ncbi:helix-turn-helix domain-containing protein [Nocardia sp. NPDC049707]|uniref:helix-turn-helix domain-containing protein n=1 Tax=Nocardia sp. NPDC049707 TaxID=3154735 RepID=UPI00343768D5